MTEERRTPGAATEERIIAGAAEFAAAASRATVLAANILQAALIAVVVLWVLDVPRQVFNVSFYTEQLLTVCLGLTLALAFIAGEARKPTAIDPGGATAAIFIAAYIVFSHVKTGEVSPWAIAGLGLVLIWMLVGSRAFAARGVDWLAAALSLAICGYIAVRYEPLTTEIALLPREGIIGSAHPDHPGAGGEPAGVRLGLRRHHPGDGGLHLHQPVSARRLPHPLRLARAARGLQRPRRQRHHQRDPAGRGADRHSVHDPRPGAGAHRRRRLLLRYRDVRHGPLPRRRRPRSRWWARAVRHDLGQRGVERARGRDRDHPDHDQVGLHALQGRRHRVPSARPAGS